MIALLCTGLALAADAALLFAPAGDWVPGTAQELTLAVWGDAGPALGGAPPVRASAGQVERVSVGAGPGLWSVRWRAPAAATPVRFTVDLPGGGSTVLTLAPAAELQAGLGGPEAVSALVGAADPVVWRVDAPPDLAPEDLQVALPEGRLVGVARVEGGLELRWQPGESREVRVVPIGLRDGRSPLAPPRWVQVRLAARAPITVRTEPGSTLSVRVAGRSYGPVTAGADGTASVQVEVRPGETIGEATLEDAAGNRQRTTIPLIRNPRPSLAVLLGGPVAHGRPAPPAWLHAVDAAGRPWAGEAPRCRATGGEAPELVAAGPGIWRVLLGGAAEGLLDLRLDCSLEDDRALASVRVPVGQGRAARVVLQVYPQELSADLPVAQVRALVEDARGDRLPPQGLTLSAAHGRLDDLREEGGALRADLVVDPAFLEDTVQAAWRLPPGRGAAWGLEAWATPTPEGVALLVRVTDREGLPIADSPLTLDTAGGPRTLRTGPGGWVQGVLPRPAGPELLTLRAGDRLLRVLWWPFDPAPPPDPQAPDLVAQQLVRVVAGRISRIAVQVSPDPLVLTGGARAQIEVLLEDRAGTPVVDEPVALSASAGTLSAVEVRADGRLVAQYTPPPGLPSGPVELWVRSERGAFPDTRASLTLLPRPVQWAPGVSVGWVTSFGALNALQLGAQLDRRVELRGRPLYLRGGITHHQELQEVQDTDRGETFGVGMRTFTLSAGVVLRQERGRISGWAGAGAALAPTWLSVSVEGEPVLDGLMMPLPGPWACAGGGWRVGAGEVFAELRGTGIQARGAEFGVEGPIGGLAVGAGYRIIY